MKHTKNHMERYLRSVKRKLRLPPDIKTRVMSDLISSIQSRQEAGNTDEEIFAELGSPSEAAAELNAQMQEYAYKKSPWRWLCLAGILLSAAALFRGGANLALSLCAFLISKQSVGIVGGVDGPTTIFIARSQESVTQGMIMSAIILIMSIIGFYSLSHMRKE